MSFLQHCSINHRWTDKVYNKVSVFFSLKLIFSFLHQRCTKKVRDNCSITSQVTGTLLSQRFSAFSGSLFFVCAMLTLNPLKWKIWWAPNNASRWQIEFKSPFKGLTRSSPYHYVHIRTYKIFLPASNFKVGHSKWRFRSFTHPSKFKPNTVRQCSEKFIPNRLQ